MKKLIGERKGGKYQSMIFVLLFIVAAFPLLIATLISYHIYIEEVTKQNDMSMEAMELQVRNELEGILLNIRQYYLEASVQDDISWLIETESIPYSEYTYLSDAQNVLKGPTYLSEYVSGYAFINMKLGWILTNNGMYCLEDIRNEEQFTSFKNLVQENSSTLYWQNNILEPSPYIKGVYQSNTLDISGYQLVMKLPGISQNIDQLVLVQLNLPVVKQKLSKSLGGYDVCIVDRTGIPLFTSDDDLWEYCSTNWEELEEQNNTQTISVGGNKEFRIQVRDLSSNGITYIIAYNLDEVIEGGSRILGVFFAIISVLLILLLVCYFITNILYKPIRKLTSFVSEAVGDEANEMDEFTRIRENVGHLIDTKESLQEMVHQQQKMLSEQFLARAIRGEMTPEAVSKGQEQFQLKKVKWYRLLTVSCMLEQETDQDSDLENEALSLMIVQKRPKEIADYLVAPMFSHNQQVLLIIGGDSDEELMSKIKAVHLCLTTYIEEEFGCSIIAGVSQNFTGLKYLRTAYNECMETLRNFGTEEQRDVTFYEEIAHEDGIISGYDFVMENSLTKAVNNGDAEGAAQLVDKFVNSLYNRGISRHDRRFYLYRLVIAVISVLSDAGLTANQVFAERTDNIFQKINDIYESDKLKHYLNTHIVQLSIQALKQYRYKAASDILKNIMQIVKERKGDITLSECAERLNYHPSYIWKVLKAERNMTFTDLVNIEKLETAKTMLLQTDYSIAEIAERLNYSNTQNFIRFFSKYAETTPGKFRKTNNHFIISSK